MSDSRWDEAAARAHVEQRLGIGTVGAQRLTGGLLNHVHRVWISDAKGSVVVKHAPPHVASAPGIPLDPGRSGFEAVALRWLETRSDSPVRTPRLIDVRPGVLILGDLGDHADLAAWLSNGGETGVVERLGQWIRALHAEPSTLVPELAVQQTRLEVQYGPVGDWLAVYGVPDAAELGARARDLGRRLLEKGRTVMGDLWPASVLVSGDGVLHVIDWELSTRGPCRISVTSRHTCGWGRGSVHGADLAGRFLTAALPQGPTSTDVAIHFACEVLIHTVGPFHAGGPSAGHANPGSEAVDVAVETPHGPPAGGGARLEGVRPSAQSVDGSLAIARRW